VWLSAVGEYRRALTTAQDAVTLRRDLAAAEPARYTPDLANSLTNLGICLERLDRADAQLQARAEAVAWWARLAELRPDDYRETYQQDRANLAKLFTDRGFDVGAASAAEHRARCDLPALEGARAASEMPKPAPSDTTDIHIR